LILLSSLVIVSLKKTKMNIYVGNLNWTMTDQDLQDLFIPFGTVSSAKIVTDKFKGNRSKGFGFVEMSSDDEARAAIAALHQSDVGGRNIIVNESQPRERTERKSFGGGGSGGGGGRRDFNKGGGGGGGGYKKNFNRRDF
jgi:RNA recognition motif-containing protein